MSDYQLGREIWTEVQEFRLGMTEGLANHVHGDHLEFPAESFSRSVEHPGQFLIGTLRFSWSVLGWH